ncbi:uncharacterized protein [Drosophila takahashii]|uniref:uncharacterized protein n=1 Tax=Drosophila takahashii TaxID=29030 RepID=UPI001CF89EBB|nr:uncharacterized protein LOC108068749 [Drosophila takahashii]
MLERRRRSQLRLDALLPVPTRTTTMRRTRRVCVNIEANGSGPIRTRRRRRRELINPYFMTYSPIYDSVQMGHQWGFDLCSNESPYEYGNFLEPPNRLNAGEGIIPSEETNNANGTQVVHDLKNILMGLDGYLHEKKVNLLKPHQDNSNTTDNQVDQSGEAQDCQLSVLTDIMCETIDRLNNYMGNHSKQQEWQSALNPMNQFRGNIPPVHVLQLPVQPLIVQTVPSYPSSDHYPSPESIFQKKPNLDRLPWLKERKRKRPSKSTTYIHLQNQGSSTDDLPKSLEGSYSSNKLSDNPRQSTKDAGTTMWCSMECGRNQERFPSTQERLQEDPEIAYSLRSTHGFPPPCLKAPPPSIKSEDELDEQGKYYHPTGESIYVLGSPQTSSFRSSCDYRREGGNLRYSFIEEEEEQVDEDDWYQSASNKLAELEVEQDFFKQMEKQTGMSSRDETPQTDLETTSDNSFVNIIATSDKALSTTGLSGITTQEPIQIERMCKKSSLKQRHKLKSGKHSGNTAGTHKVMFEKVQHTEGVQVQQHPMRKESIPKIPKVKRTRSNQIRSISCHSSTFRSKR